MENRWSSLLLVALASASSGCGGDGAGAPPTVEDRVRWRPGDERRPVIAVGPSRELGLLRLAQAPAAGVEPPTLLTAPPPHRLPIGLWSDDEVYAAGRTFAASDPRLEPELRRQVRRSREADPDAPVELLVDRSRTWGQVARVAGFAVEGPPSRPPRLQVAVLNADVLDGLLELRVSAPPPGAPPSAALAIDVVDRDGVESPRVRVAERAWTFPAGDPYARGPSLDAANAAWSEIHAALAATAAPGGAGDSPAPAASLDPRAPWPHTVQLLALAQAAGWRRLRIDSLAGGVEVELRSPPNPPLVRRWRVGLPSAPLAPEPRDPRDLPVWASLVVGAGLAAAVVFGPWLRFARRRR